MVILHPVMKPLWIAYGLGDLSGGGFGGQLALTDLIPHIEIVFWCTKDS